MNMSVHQMSENRGWKNLKNSNLGLEQGSVSELTHYCFVQDIHLQTAAILHLGSNQTLLRTTKGLSLYQLIHKGIA